MADIVNRVHVSPGIYATETVDMKAAANSIGITKLAVVGETLKGPAFQPYWIHSPKEYASVFGGTSTEKYKGSKYPKYELPYIANEYLKKGTELCVVKTLGFSGYNAGPAWVITGTKAGSTDKVVIAVLRSRGGYKYRPDFAGQVDQNGCPCNDGNDVMTFDVGEKKTVRTCNEPISYNMGAVSLSPYSSLLSDGTECSDYSLSSTEGGFGASYLNLGRFTINCIVGASDNNVDSPSGVDNVVHISVSLNKGDNDYILNVLGSSNNDGDAPLFVETLYDVAWKDYVESGEYDTISSELTAYNVAYISDYCGLLPVDGFLTKNGNDLKKSDFGKRFLCSSRFSDTSEIEFYEFDYLTGLPNGSQEIVKDGCIYTVRQVVDERGQKKYVYSAYSAESTDGLSGDEKIMAQDKLLLQDDETIKHGTIIYNNEDGLYYKIAKAYIEIKDSDWPLTITTVPTNQIGVIAYSGSQFSVQEDYEGYETYFSDSHGTHSKLYEVDYDKMLFEYKEEPEDASGLVSISGQTYQPFSINTTMDGVDGLSGGTMHQFIGKTSSTLNNVIKAKQPLTSWPQRGASLMNVSVLPNESAGSAGSVENLSGYTIVYVPTQCTGIRPSCSGDFCKINGNYTCTPYARPIRVFTNPNTKHAKYKEVERNDDFKWKAEQGKKYQVADWSFSAQTIINLWYYSSSYVDAITCDMNDYKGQYRYSSTPWVVSNVKGDAKNIELNKMFRFHTISDGVASLTEVKVSVENIKPDSGEFDIVVRDYNDTDANPTVLEAFRRCVMGSGKNSVAYKIGTIDGMYESKSKYITVEVAEGSAAENGVPCGFLGYTIPNYDGLQIGYGSNNYTKIAPISYNKKYYQDVPKKKQYFGLSEIAGYDVDYFTFKGNMASIEEPGFVTHGFHLDSRLDTKIYTADNAPHITVDGVEGYVFDTVGINERTSTASNTPIIDSESNMYGSIFEDVKLRKFTMMFAGGFDGWDEYREQRTNTNEFSYTNYQGNINTKVGVGRNFDALANASMYDIEGNAITSDYYATLAGVSLLKNPEEVDINLLATPGIDTINNTQLIGEIFEVLEERADTFYIVTTPDKYAGDSEYVEDIPDVDDIADDFVENELYSDNAATYYPWVKIEDNGEYIWLPATRDVVRNLAESDNTNTTMNLAPAGTSRGKVDAIRARKNLKNAESDTLYDANINPVRTYAQNGLVVMGQKTLRKEDDLMNRVDVRRMVLRMRKLIAIGCIGLIFEPYDNATVKAFRSIINGIMQTFVDNRAVEKWAMDVDDSQEMRDRLELSAVIYVKPVRALEYITLNFVVTNNDVYFDN